MAYKIMKRAAIFIAVVILGVAATVTTAMAFHEELREMVKEIIFDFFHAEEEEVVPELSGREEISIENMYVEQDRKFPCERELGYDGSPMSDNQFAIADYCGEAGIVSLAYKALTEENIKTYLTL